MAKDKSGFAFDMGDDENEGVGSKPFEAFSKDENKGFGKALRSAQEGADEEEDEDEDEDEEVREVRAIVKRIASGELDEEAAVDEILACVGMSR